MTNKNETCGSCTWYDQRTHAEGTCHAPAPMWADIALRDLNEHEVYLGRMCYTTDNAKDCDMYQSAEDVG